jgi:hypothetical protein
MNTDVTDDMSLNVKVIWVTHVYVSPNHTLLRKFCGDFFVLLLNIILYQNNYIYFSAWIEESQIKPYFEFKDQLIKSNKSGAFKDALQAIEDFIKSSGDVSTYFTFLFKLLSSFLFLFCSSRFFQIPLAGVGSY